MKIIAGVGSSTTFLSPYNLPLIFRYRLSKIRVSVKTLFDRNVVRGPTKDVEHLLDGEIIVTIRMLRHIDNVKNLNNEICLL